MIFVATIIVGRIKEMKAEHTNEHRNAQPPPPQHGTSTRLIPSAEFKVKHMMISQREGTIRQGHRVLDSGRIDLANSRVEALIEAASMDTLDAQRDAHLKSADFFDVEKFPTLSFKSTRINRSGWRAGR